MTPTPGPTPTPVRETPARVRLPRTGAMRVPGIVFASDALLPPADALA